MELRHREAVWGDIGNILKIEGLVVGGEGGQAVLMLPGAELKLHMPPAPDISRLDLTVHHPDAEEWAAWLQQSDNPEVLMMPAKAFHRKVRYEVSGAVQQKVWVADGLKCMFCGRKMGEVQLTIDHWVPLELGGENNTKNYLSACRRCNKDKGAMSPRDWCVLKGLNYNDLIRHLACREIA